tara:strand:- start:466 stop:897 length:432 start_codon:yes stop_codon:yes gene_type:complete
MSTLKANTLTGTTSAGSIVVTGEGGSTTTNLQQGLAKAWANVNQGTPSIRDSLNLSSNTDNGEGDFTANWSNNFSAAEYVAAGMATNDGTNYTRGPGGFYQKDTSAMTTSSHTTIACWGSSSSSNGYVKDKTYALQMYMGDLA